MPRLVQLVTVVALATAGVTVASGARPGVPRHDPPDRSALASLPLVFEANQGQFDPTVRYAARAAGHAVYVTDAGIALVERDGQTTRLWLEGARGGATPTGKDPLPTTVSSFTGSDPDRWRAGIPTYRAVEYRGIREGVDLVLYGNGPALEYDLVVAPGADPAALTLAVQGTGAPLALTLAPTGDLRVEPGGLRLLAPRLYQDLGGRRTAVSGRYSLRGEGRFGFQVGPYDPTRALVIDPVVVSASYVGGSSTDTGYDVARDAEGNLLITGYTESTDFPTVSPSQPALAQHPEGTRTDVFVTKLKADGSAVVWSTYLGGQGRDAGFAVAAGPDGSVYIAGYTESTDLPARATGSGKVAQAKYAGGASDVVVAKLSPGGALVYATYLGGRGNDLGSGIAVDQAGAAYVVGSTSSADFPLMGPVRSTLGSADDVDGFVTKIDPTGASLVYSTLLGGSSDDHAVGVAVDGGGNAYVTGDTRSSNFPTVRPVQATPGGAGQGIGTSFADAFVAKLDPGGGSLVYSTYLGGADSDKGTSIAVDAQGNAYVTGNTGSANFPVVNPLQPRKDGDFDAFVAKLDPTGSTLAYSTYLGGSQSDGAEGIAVDRSGNAWVVGTTASPNFPLARPFQGAKGGGFVDAFVSQLNPSGSSLLASSYLGGRDDDQGAGVTIGPDGNVTVVGYTNSPDFPLARPFQAAKGGGVGDAFVAQIQPDFVGGGKGAGGSASPLSSAQQDRVRTWVTITGGLLVAAVLQTLWLRRRRSPKPSPARAGTPTGPRRAAGGGQGQGQGSKRAQRQGAQRQGAQRQGAQRQGAQRQGAQRQGAQPPRKPAGKPVPSGRSQGRDQAGLPQGGAVRTAKAGGPGAGSGTTEPRQPPVRAAAGDRSGSDADDLTLVDAPLSRLKLTHPAPPPPEPAELTAPDLLADHAPFPSGGTYGGRVGPAAPSRAGGGEADLWGPPPTDSSMWLARALAESEGEPLSPADTWLAPLTPSPPAPVAPSPAAGVVTPAAPPPPPRAGPARAVSEPDPVVPRPLESPTLEQAPRLPPQPAPPAPPPPPPAPQSAPATTPATQLAAAAAADLASAAASDLFPDAQRWQGRQFEQGLGTVQDTEEWSPAVEPGRPAPTSPDLSDLSLDELLSEDLPIPDGPGSDELPFSIADLLDEDMDIAPAALAAPAAPLSPPSPRPAHPYGDLFTPDPDDPLVRATREAESQAAGDYGDDEEGTGGRPSRARRRER